MKATETEYIKLECMLGALVDNALRDAVILAVTNKCEVCVEHNGKEYWFNGVTLKNKYTQQR